MQGTLRYIRYLNYATSLGIGLAVSYHFLGEQWFIGFGLFLAGWLFKPSDDTNNDFDQEHLGPNLPWPDMHAGDRFSYFLPAFAPAILGGVIAAVGFSLTGQWLDYGLMFIGILLMGMGSVVGAFLWKSRLL
ncbi:hypothetical protein [Parerythrobacter aestuarii]|uniref:hypothetical protein n=1 Tax=Parerythrobacter aestuarii TaxID=3020909 RepID=UPI0024DECCC7|nr:hypothetical protein [Parerythrobacter aestuarii]